MTPKRIQRKRARGWRMPENAVYVGRPSRWGNPFVVGEAYMWIAGLDWPIPTWRDPGVYDGLTTFRVERCGSVEQAVAWYREWVTSISLRVPGLEPLRGRDLVCWCPEPCGSDVDLGWGEFGGPYDPCALFRGHDGHHDPSATPCHADVLLELANA